MYLSTCKIVYHVLVWLCFAVDVWGPPNPHPSWSCNGSTLLLAFQEPGRSVFFSLLPFQFSRRQAHPFFFPYSVSSLYVQHPHDHQTFLNFQLVPWLRHLVFARAFVPCRPHKKRCLFNFGRTFHWYTLHTYIHAVEEVKCLILVISECISLLFLNKEMKAHGALEFEPRRSLANDGPIVNIDYSREVCGRSIWTWHLMSYTKKLDRDILLKNWA